MIFPWQLSTSLVRYTAGNALRGTKQFPFVLMLEPTFACNLTCAGCGRIREDVDIAHRMLTLEECLAAVDDAGAPVVSIAGGEPLLHPRIDAIVEGIVARKRFVYLCSNGIALARSLQKFRPSPYFSFVFHLDGLADTHDGIAGRGGVFDTAIAGIKAAKVAGFQVRTNTTLFKGASPDEVVELFSLLTSLGVDGMMIAPGFSYEEVGRDIFLSRQEAVETFRPIYDRLTRFRLHNSPIYIDFLAGKRELQCVPWSTPTRNPKGWKRPCYLLADGYCGSFRELVEKTAWEAYGVGRDSRCANCMVHSGFEASSMDVAGRSASGMWRMARWMLFG